MFDGFVISEVTTFFFLKRSIFKLIYRTVSWKRCAPVKFLIHNIHFFHELLTPPGATRVPSPDEDIMTT